MPFADCWQNNWAKYWAIASETLLVASCIGIAALPVRAQLVPDKTLEAESRVTSQETRKLIEGGTRRGSQLFHSFAEFNVNEGQRVDFANPGGVNHILTRVTGNTLSTILGTLGVNGNANLFLLNPNGVVFGPNARLDVAGSFAASTANHITVVNYEFSANPTTEPLLQMNVTPGVQYGAVNPSSTIQNQGNLAVGGQSLSLVGGNVKHTGALVAPGGSVNIIGETIQLLGTADTRSLEGVGSLFLNSPSMRIAEGGAISGAAVSQALATNHVVLEANNLLVDADITGVAENHLSLQVGRSLTVGNNRTIALNGGNFTATVINENAIANQVAQFSMNPGSQILTNGGDVTVAAQNGQINTANGRIVTVNPVTPGGNGGDISLFSTGDMATGLLVSGFLTLPNNAFVVLDIADAANGGDITLESQGAITTDNFILALAQLDSGDIILDAAGNLTINAQIKTGGNSAGKLTLTSGDTFLARGDFIDNQVLGSGFAADVTLAAPFMILDDTAIATVTTGNAQGGDLLVHAEEVVLRNGRLATVAFQGSGDAGDLTLNTRRLSIIKEPGTTVTQGVGVATTASFDSSGNGGDLVINASESIEIVGDRPSLFTPTPKQLLQAITEQVDTGIATSAVGSGNSGNLSINTGRLVVRDGVGVTTLPLVGRGGQLRINANEVELRGSAKLSTATLGQDAGNLSLDADRVTLTNGALIATNTFSSGDAGDLTLTADQLVIGNGSSVSSITTGAGASGTININAANLEVRGTSADGSLPSSISANSLAGSGNAGNLTISSDRLLLRQGGEISTATAGAGAGGNIQIEARQIQIENGRINASTATSQPGGNVTLRASEAISVVGRGFETLQQQIIVPAFNGTLSFANFDQGVFTVTAGAGAAGDISIDTPNFTVRDGGLTATTTLASGAGGDINVNAGDTLEINNSLLATGTFTAAASGHINLTARRLLAEGGAQAITTTFGEGRAGNLTVNVAESIDLIDPSQQGFVSGLFASSFQSAAGTGGDITVTTGDFNILDGAAVSVSGQGAGDAGNIEITARVLFLDEGEINASSASGAGGNLTLDVGEALILRNGSEISTRAGTLGGGGNGGNIDIEAEVVVGVPSENSDITANAFAGTGGEINLSAETILGFQVSDTLTPQSDISASSRLGIDGTIALDTPDVDPSDGITELSTELTDAGDQMIAGCPSNEEANFIVTGRGGLPPDPSQELPEQILLPAWDLEASAHPQNSVSDRPLQTTGQASSPASSRINNITEAQGWTLTKDGKLVLVASNQSETYTQHPQCHEVSSE
ncbi:MAG: filamentous hemagglutinin N-terminal domain-containing protein [Cyanophyceae cyanobacterium]